MFLLIVFRNLDKGTICLDIHGFPDYDMVINIMQSNRNICGIMDSEQYIPVLWRHFVLVQRIYMFTRYHVHAFTNI